MCLLLHEIKREENEEKELNSQLTHAYLMRAQSKTLKP